MKTKIQKQIVNRIRQASKIAVMAHRNGDGDSYGAACGLKLGLEKIGKTVEILSETDLPESLLYLYNYANFEFRNTYIPADLLLIVDVSQENILSLPEIYLEYVKNNVGIIVIDHHTANKSLSKVDLALVEQNACSTCEIIYEILTDLEVPFDKALATLLLTGIETDTSSFQNANTNAACFAVASELMAKGARLSAIINQGISSFSVGELKLFGLAMDRLRVDRKTKVGITYLTYKDAKKYGEDTESFELIVNYLNQVKGALMIVFLKQIKPGEVRVSLRTRDEDVDVSKIAKYFGGGGHIKASGFTLAGDIIEKDNKILVV